MPILLTFASSLDLPNAANAFDDGHSIPDPSISTPYILTIGSIASGLWQMSLNFHQLLLFYTVAQLGSVTRAAKALRISQPSVSTQLREFEQRQGVELLRRLPRGMALTDAGRVAFAHSQKVFVAADNLQSALDGFRKAETGR